MLAMMGRIGFWLCSAGLHKWSNHAIFGIIKWCRRCGHRK